MQKLKMWSMKYNHGCAQALNNWASLHISNIKLSENRKIYSSKHLYKYSKEDFKMIPINHKTNTLGKGMNPILPPVMGK